MVSDMFTEEDARSFEERRDEVIALMMQALDPGGRDRYLGRAARRCRKAHTEREFGSAYESLVDAISHVPFSS